MAGFESPPFMMAEKTKKPKKGDIRPVYQQMGYQVCKDPEKDIWIPTEKIAEAEILSNQLKE